MNCQRNECRMELSVIIVSFNVSEFLRKCLLSVKKAGEYVDCEIFVVDNNSEDDSCLMIESDFPEVILLKNKTNNGFSVANNQAIKLSKGRFILLLNPDTLIEEDTFFKCIEFMKTHPDAGAVGVRMIDGKGRFLPESKRGLPKPETAFFKAFGLARLFPKSRLFNKYYLSDVNNSETSKAEVLSGAFMLIRKEALEKTGMLDEEFFMYGEDIDLSYRLLKAGYYNYYFPEVQIIHYKGSSTKRDRYTDIFHFYDAMRIYVRKHHMEDEIKYSYPLIISAIYFRQGLALINRTLNLIFKLCYSRFLVLL